MRRTHKMDFYRSQVLEQDADVAMKQLFKEDVKHITDKLNPNIYITDETSIVVENVKHQNDLETDSHTVDEGKREPKDTSNTYEQDEPDIHTEEGKSIEKMADCFKEQLKHFDIRVEAKLYNTNENTAELHYKAMSENKTFDQSNYPSEEITSMLRKADRFKEQMKHLNLKVDAKIYMRDENPSTIETDQNIIENETCMFSCPKCSGSFLSLKSLRSHNC